jgi:hypothetical protein
MPKAPTLLAALSALPLTLFAWSAAAAPPGPVPPPAPAVAQGAIPAESAPDPYDVRYPKKSAGVFVNPLGLVFGVFGAEVDFKLAEVATINVGGSYYRRSISILDSTTTTNAFGGDLGAQFFPLGRAFNQLYVYPRVSYARASATRTEPGIADMSANSSVLGVGATVGYQWTYNPGFSLRLGAGMMYYSALAKDDNSTVEIALSGVFPAIDASLGWTF